MISAKRLLDTDDTSHVTASNFRHEGEMIKGTLVVAKDRENFPVIPSLIFKRGVAVRDGYVMTSRCARPHKAYVVSF